MCRCPVDAPSVAAVLHDAGYRTAIIGKPHFEPFLDPFARFAENRFARSACTTTQPWFDGTTGPHRGFEHFESATHTGAGPLHYARWLAANHPEAVGMFYPVLDPGSRSTRSAAATPARRRCTTTRSRASGTTPTGWPIARSPGSTRSPPTTTGSAG